MSNQKFSPLLLCQNEDCAKEQSFPLNSLRKYRGSPICYDCYYDMVWNQKRVRHWENLPKITLADLRV